MTSGPKVVGVGLHKTGTTSLGQALEQFGYRVAGPYGLSELARGTSHSLVVGRALDEVAPEYDAFQDYPWFGLYREMDQLFPGSKFILTTRDEDQWWASMLRQVGRQRLAHLDPTFGHRRVLGRKDQFLATYRAHNLAVTTYFAKTSDRLLVMDLSEPDAYSRLAAFLDRDPLPDGRMPHAYSSDSKTEGLSWLRRCRSAARQRLLHALFG